MKKFLIILLSLVLVIFCAGCDIGTYNPPITPDTGDGSTSSGGDPSNTPGDNNGNNNGGNNGGNTDPDGKYTFTVTLYETNGSGEKTRYYPKPGEDLQVMWTGSGSVAYADFDSTGIASYTGLDGDYRVTLSKAPATHTYDPNGITANNNNRDVEILLIPIRTPTGRNDGTDEHPIVINIEGAYRVSLSNAEEQKYYRYTPSQPGIYSIKTLIDAEAGLINSSTIRFYMSNAGGYIYPTPIETNSGKPNASWQTYLDAAEIGNPRLFTISVDSENYPVEIYFALTYEGEYQAYEPVLAHGPFYTGPSPTGTFKLSWRDNVYPSGGYATDGLVTDMRFDLNWNDADGNGMWTPKEWTDTRGDGVFKIGDEWWDTNGNGVFDSGDEWLDANGNGELNWTDLNGNGVWDEGEGEWWRDTNGNGVFDKGDEWRDTDGNGRYNAGDQWKDSNGNGVCDVGDEWLDTNGNGVLDWTDLNDNGVWDEGEGEWWRDTNGNGVFDEGDQWSDLNGIFDSGDEWIDLNGNGVFDWVDLNGNGEWDEGEGDRWRDTNKNGAFDLGDAWWDTDGDGECGLDTGDGFYHFFEDVVVRYDAEGNPVTTRVYGGLLWVELLVSDNIMGSSGYGYKGGQGDGVYTRDKDYSFMVTAYRPYCKSSRHPVNKELMEMFQDIAVAQSYFDDGNGVAERGNFIGEQIYNGPYIHSAHDTMFLLFCGYYS